MSVITLCILLLCIQPFIIYKSMFCHKEIEDKSDLEFELSFLVIAPSFIFFYLDIFWYALLLLSSVGILGGLLSKLFESKAKRSLPLKELYYFLIVWLCLFSVGYGLVSLWGLLVGDVAEPIISNAVELTITDVTVLGAPLAVAPTKPILPIMLPSLYYLAAFICVFIIRVVEVNRKNKEELSALLLLVLSVAGSILPFFSDYYFLSLLFNFIVFISLARAIIVYKETDPSSGAIMFIYGYAFIMAAVLSLMCRGVIWLQNIF